LVESVLGTYPDPVDDFTIVVHRFLFLRSASNEETGIESSRRPNRRDEPSNFFNRCGVENQLMFQEKVGENRFVLFDLAS